MNKITDPLAFLGKRVSVEIDRPLGSLHPKYPDLIYEVNYGFIPDTLSYDGEQLDAYVLFLDRPVESFCGICIAVIQRKDDEAKLIVIPEGQNNPTDEEIRDIVLFQEKYFNSSIVCRTNEK